MTLVREVTVQVHNSVTAIGMNNLRQPSFQDLLRQFIDVTLDII